MRSHWFVATDQPHKKFATFGRTHVIYCKAPDAQVWPRSAKVVRVFPDGFENHERWIDVACRRFKLWRCADADCNTHPRTPRKVDG